MSSTLGVRFYELDCLKYPAAILRPAAILGSQGGGDHRISRDILGKRHRGPSQQFRKTFVKKYELFFLNTSPSISALWH